MTKGSNIWFYVQLAIISFCGMLGLQGIWKDSKDLETHLYWYAPILILIGASTMVIFFGGIYAFSKPTNQIWRRPSWRRNPLSGWLIFAHLSAFNFMAAGAVLFLTQIFKTNGALITAFWYIAGGVGVWIGVQLCMKIFSHKMEK